MNLTVLAIGPEAAATTQALAEAIQVSGRVPTTRQLSQDPVQVLADLRSASGCVIACGGEHMQLAPSLTTALHELGGDDVPGFGELLRLLAWNQMGARAMLIEAHAVRVGDVRVYALPADPALALLAWTELIHPNRPAADDAQQGDAPKPGATLDIHELHADSSAPPPEDDLPPVGWQRALKALGGKLDARKFTGYPRSFSRVAPARDVLFASGEQGTITLEDGSRYSAFGYPDLRRAGSKVLLVAKGNPIAEVIALHRHPTRVGLVSQRETDGWLPGADWDPDPLAEELVGRPTPAGGTLFAIDGDAIYVQRGLKIYRWDGRNEKNMGTVSQALGTLMLRWSSK